MFLLFLSKLVEITRRHGNSRRAAIENLYYEFVSMNAMIKNYVSGSLKT